MWLGVGMLAMGGRFSDITGVISKRVVLSILLRARATRKHLLWKIRLSGPPLRKKLIPAFRLSPPGDKVKLFARDRFYFFTQRKDHLIKAIIGYATLTKVLGPGIDDQICFGVSNSRMLD